MRGCLEDTIFPKKYFPKTQECLFFKMQPRWQYQIIIITIFLKILGLTLDYKLACYQEKNTY